MWTLSANDMDDDDVVSEFATLTSLFHLPNFTSRWLCSAPSGCFSILSSLHGWHSNSILVQTQHFTSLTSEINSWLACDFMKLNSDKTQVLLFGTKLIIFCWPFRSLPFSLSQESVCHPRRAHSLSTSISITLAFLCLPHTKKLKSWFAACRECSGKKNEHTKKKEWICFWSMQKHSALNSTGCCDWGWWRHRPYDLPDMSWGLGWGVPQ